MTVEWLRLAWAAVHPERIVRVVDDAGGDPARAIAALESDGVRVPAADDVLGSMSGRTARFELPAEWGDRFGHVEDAPRWLFVEGEIGGGPLIAIVGTRHCTEYGRRLARELAAACASSGWGVVSGLARGIDQAAHRGAVDGGGVTVAVLGSGTDVDYPRGTQGLRRQIIAQGGGVVSEYPPDAEPLPWRFPARNRIISGLSAAVVVVETPATGGSLSTVARAEKQARPVFAVPGDIDRSASVGCNRLIRDGAIPVLGAEDLVASLALL